MKGCSLLNMKPRKFEIISCPHCGRQYLPAEIFYPNYYFGRPSNIIRDVFGNILDYDGTSIDIGESYTCDKCNTTFEIKGKIQFVVEENKIGNFDEEYVTPIKTNSLFADE